MKRFQIAVAVLFLIAAFSGCAIEKTAFPSVMPQPTQVATQVPSIATPVESSPIEPSPTLAATQEPSPTPEETIAEPIEIIPTTNKYTSTRLGLSFTVPQSWIGKYRVEEGDGFLIVHFYPEEPLGEYSWSGELFSIVDEEFEDWDVFGEWEFERNGEIPFWGITDPLSYGPEAPEYGTYKVMQKDVESVFASLRSTSGQAITNAKRLWNEVIPTKTKYTTTMGLGISFTLPKSWIGKCSIVESKDDVSFYFKPKDYDPYAYGDGWIFSVFIKTSDNDADMLDGVREITVGGVTFICGGPTDVSYEGPEQDSFFAMGDGIHEIIDSVCKVK